VRRATNRPVAAAGEKKQVYAAMRCHLYDTGIQPGIATREKKVAAATLATARITAA